MSVAQLLPEIGNELAGFVEQMCPDAFVCVMPEERTQFFACTHTLAAMFGAGEWLHVVHCLSRLCARQLSATGRGPADTCAAFVVAVRAAWELLRAMFSDPAIGDKFSAVVAAYDVVWRGLDASETGHARDVLARSIACTHDSRRRAPCVSFPAIAEFLAVLSRIEQSGDTAFAPAAAPAAVAATASVVLLIAGVWAPTMQIAHPQTV